MTNYDAALANCRRVELATYQSLTNDPQFIFPKIPAGSYEMRCTITRKDLQHLESSLEVYWKDEECGFSDQVKLTSENDDGSYVELYFILKTWYSEVKMLQSDRIVTSEVMVSTK